MGQGQTPTDVAIANLAFSAFWIAVVATVLILGRWLPRVRAFRDRMIAQWKPSLAIAALFLIGIGLGGRGFLNPYALAILCQALIGLALARGIGNFEPLPATKAILARERLWRNVGLLLGISVLVVLPALLIGSVGLSVGRQIFGETNRTAEAMGTFPTNKWSTFFLLLSGAGIAEETTYRLVLLSLFWRLTRRRWLAVVISSMLFGAYHLTPLDSMYRTFWQFPISQFVASTLIGVLWGILFVKRGYETAVVGHTLSDWIPFMIFGAG